MIAQCIVHNYVAEEEQGETDKVHSTATYTAKGFTKFHNIG